MKIKTNKLAFSLMIAKLIDGASTEQLTEWSGCTPDTVRETINHLKRVGAVYVHKWENQGKPYCHAIYKIGKEPDAIRVTRAIIRNKRKESL